VLFGLAGVAVTQPLLDLFGRNPTFFVAGHYETGQIVAFAVIVALVPGVVVFAVTTLPGLAFRRLADVWHTVGVALLAGLFGLVLCRTLHIDRLRYVLVAVLLLAATVALVERRSRTARQFLALLAAGNLAFVVLFLTASPTAELIGAPVAAGQRGRVELPPLDGPVVVVVLDELPVTSIMRGDGTINDTRYPNFARLAQRSTWFRDAASESQTTYVSVPTILTGVRSDNGLLPILADHPRNLFSLFGDRYPVNRYEVLTDLCPEDACERRPPSPMRQLLDDASLVYRHRVLPHALRRDLPPIGTRWGNFGETVAGPAGSTGAAPPTTEPLDPMTQFRAIPDDEVSPGGQAAVVQRQLSLVDAEPSLNFVHVMLPHHPYVLTPWGDGPLPVTRLPDEVASGREQMPPPDDPAHDFWFRQLYQLQAMQLGALDQLIGEMIDDLESSGAWDDALVVVTSDHGIDMTAPKFTRAEDDGNTDELYRIPLFIKAPGQAEGRIEDSPASTLDILPSLMGLLDIEADWELEGHSLYDGSEPVVERHVTTGVEAAMAVAASHEAQFPRGEDWVALAAVGEGEDLVGARVSEQQIGEPSPLRWALDHGDDLDDLSLADDAVPYIMEGVVSGARDRPPELVVAVNGTLAGTVGGYVRVDDHWQFTGYIAPFFRDGRNQVAAYEVERTGGTVTLHPVSG
jgi:hypothetical protein